MTAGTTGATGVNGVNQAADPTPKRNSTQKSEHEGMRVAPVTVSADDAVRALRDALCSALPVTTRRGGVGADIHLVHGGRGWSGRAAGPGVRIVIDPVHEPIADLEALAATGSTVLLSEAYADSPALRASGGVAAGHSVYVVDAICADPDEHADRSGRSDHADHADAPGRACRQSASAEDQLLTQLRVLRAAGVTDVTVTVATRHRGGVTWSGTAVGHSDEPAQLCGVAGVSAAGPARLSVHALSTDRSVEIALPSGATATPATVTTTTGDGSLTQPTIYETAHRGVLSRAAASVRDTDASGTRAPSDRPLDSFIRDARVVSAALSD
ncbi:MAG: hypothetical protein ACTJHU_00270 [Mycetocola sp.]